MSSTERKGPGIPSLARRRLGPVACIECFQQIPCNPCEEACPRSAIRIGDEITGLPVLDEEKCNGCGICMTRCPGLAIFSLDETWSDTSALVSFPYEYVPLPVKGQPVRCTDRIGAYVTDGIIHEVRTAKAFDHTAIVTVEIPKEYAMEVRFIDRHTFVRQEVDVHE
ncbi:MAG: 4Fe-4S binding protein [Clostridiales bacterium]|nr:4Fe-4S binding protein [Clostridiales bacterium]